MSKIKVDQPFRGLPVHDEHRTACEGTRKFGNGNPGWRSLQDQEDLKPRLVDQFLSHYLYSIPLVAGDGNLLCLRTRYGREGPLACSFEAQQLIAEGNHELHCVALGILDEG